MKKTLAMFAILTIGAVVLLEQPSGAQQRLSVKVKNSEIVTGVVIVHVQKGAQTLDLQCNEGANSCAALPTGNYLMVQLSKNYGMYDCQNIEIFRGDLEKPDAAQKAGSYCLVEN